VRGPMRLNRQEERGRNAHTHGLIRGYFPKGTDFRAVTSEDVQRVQDALNARPRKALGYRTPQEVMAAAATPEGRLRDA